MHLRKTSIFTFCFLLFFSFTLHASPTLKKIHPKEPIIATGTIMLASLNTAIDGNHPSDSIVATIVDGKYAGAKLQGRLTETVSKSGQLDRTIVYFSAMTFHGRPLAKNIAAYAIASETARTALEHGVANTYLKRQGSILAASFLQSHWNIDLQDDPSQNQAPKKLPPSFLVNAGSDVGVLFMTNVERS